MKEIEIALALNELDLDNVKNELTVDDIKRQYKLLISYYHPDRNDSAAFGDGEKAKKVNAAKDFLIENLNEVNAYIRKLTNRQTEDDIRRERAQSAEEEAKRQAEYERKRYAYEQAEARRRAEDAEFARQRAEQERKRREEAEIERMAREAIAYAEMQAKINAEREEKRKKRAKSSMIFALIIAPISLILTILTAIFGGFNSFDGVPVTLYSIFLTGPIVILEAIPATRNKLFTRFLCPFLLFVVFIFFLASLGI